MEALAISEKDRAPGCYASPSVFSRDSSVCSSCSAYAACEAACLETLKAIRDKINVDDLLARHQQVRAATAQPQKAEPQPEAKIDPRKFLPSPKKPTEKVERKAPVSVVSHDLTDEQERIIGGLNKKSQDLATKWCKSGVIEKIRTDMSQRVNPFASQGRLDHCSVVCDELLNGTVTKQSLKKAFMTKLGTKRPWDEATASSHVGIAMPILVAFGVAQETSEGWVLSPGSAA